MQEEQGKLGLRKEVQEVVPSSIGDWRWGVEDLGKEALGVRSSVIS